MMETAKEKGGGDEDERCARVESMGWLTESAVMPKKQRVIEGVGASSIVELKAELYRTQEEVRRTREGLPVDIDERRSRKPADLLAKANRGVEERARKDKLHLKETTEPDTYAALEKKAALYEQLVNGELPDEEDKEKYSVDFLRKSFKEEGVFVRKGFLEDEENETFTNDDERPPYHDMAHNPHVPHPTTSTHGRPNERDEGRGREHKQMIEEVNMETKDARERARVLKERRKSQAERTREKLKAAFLKKQALRNAPSPANTS